MVSLSSREVSSAQRRSENEKVARRRAPRGLTAQPIYEPDFDRQVEAILYLLRLAASGSLSVGDASAPDERSSLASSERAA